MASDARILIIEKDKRVKADLEKVCRKIDAEAHKASTWSAARSRLKRHYYEIIIISLAMPGTNALSIIHQIRKMGLDSCLMVTALPKEVKKISTCLKEGAYDIILKPIHPLWTAINIKRAFERRRYYDEAQKKDHYWKLSIFDELTRIYNHRHFHDSLDGETNSAKRYRYPVSLLMMDIDDFKRYNDAHGHLAGDEVLRALGSLFSRCIRDGDLVARYGGEEFAMILPHTNKNGAMQMAERMRREVERLNACHLTISIGVATFPQDAKTKDELIRKADKTLYRAKHAGKNRVFRC